MKPFKLPEDFLLGTATAALQIEGGDTNNNWYEWCEAGHIKDGSHSKRANDHYNRVEEDIGLMSQINASCYRMGLEWSRLEPKEGCFSSEAVAHYRREILLLKQAGIEPLVTLFHFSYPTWFSKSGAFEADTCVERFKRYVLFCVESFGDLVSEWVTINEPNVFAVSGYVQGVWPPGKKDIPLALKIMRNLALCHLETYPIIHKVRKERTYPGETRVGVAHHLRIFEPHSNSPTDRLLTWFLKRAFQEAVVKVTTKGSLSFPLGMGSPKGVGPFCDFLGINYYSRDKVKATAKGMFKQLVQPGAPTNDLGWEIYPEGLYRLCKDMYQKYGIPIYITENGTCDAEDKFRAQYIADHLYQVSRLIEEGIPVKRYYYWSLMDNFEWIEGESARFGLIHCDYETQKRTIRKSGRVFSAISRDKGLTQDVIDEFEIK
ncbi:MAG: glycoside hydrolase family 1 protein [Clostridia bacterium]|nr:glycoside hydrolase family 1 protein [Clostridia bacterium]